MPGLNKQGPSGSGAMSGRQQGMCRRTDELPMQGRRDGQGRGMGGRCRGAYFENPAQEQPVVEKSAAQSEQSMTQELSTLRKEYKNAQAMLETLMQKIETLESGKGSGQHKDHEGEG